MSNIAQETRNIWARQSDDQDDLVSNNTDDVVRDDDSIERLGGKPVAYTSQWAALIIIVNVTVGVGLLAMPYSMQSTGIVASILIQLVLFVLIVITCIIAIELTFKSGVDSYHQIIKKHCHPFLYQFTHVATFLLVFGTTIAYIVTIGDQTDRLFASLYGSTFCHSWYMNRHFIMTITTVVALIPLCSARTVDFLKYASFLGIISIGFVFYVVLIGFINVDKIASDVNYYPKSWMDLAAILPVFCLGYQCHLSLVPVVATMHRRDKPKSFITTTIALIVVTIIYAATSILAILTFGSIIQKDLTESYPGNDRITLTTIVIVAIKSVLTLPAAFLPARLSIVDTLDKYWVSYSLASEPTRRISVTVVFLIFALMIALTVPDIMIAVSLLGCLAVAFIFQLPGLAYLSLIRQNRLQKQEAAGFDHEVPKYTARDKMKLVTSYFMIVFGFLMTAVVLYKSVKEILDNKPGPPLCHD